MNRVTGGRKRKRVEPRLVHKVNKTSVRTSSKTSKCQPRVAGIASRRNPRIKSKVSRRKRIFLPKNRQMKLKKANVVLALFVCLFAIFIMNRNDILAYFTDLKSITNIFSINAEYIVTFNRNSGTGTMPAQTISYNVGTHLTANSFTKEGYTFVGWNTEADGTGISYTEGQSVINIGNIELFAQWEKKPVKYAVQIYGINQDEDLDGNSLGLTFGPATGENYNNKYITHAYEEITGNPGNYYVKIVTHTVAIDGTETTSAEYLYESGGTTTKVTRTTAEKNKYDINMNEMTWAQIAQVSDKTSFLDCMLCGDTKSVILNLNDTIGRNNTYDQYGDGTGVLFYTVQPYFRKWNPSSVDNAAAINGGTNGSNARNAGGYSSSHIRATLIGENSKTDITYAGDENLKSYNCLYSCIEKDLRNIITAKKVKYVTGTYYTTGNYNLNDDIEDKIWLFSEREIYGTGARSGNTTEGIGLVGEGYSKFGNNESKYYMSSYNNDQTNNRKCYIEDGNNGLIWLRSPILTYDTSAHSINVHGGIDNYIGGYLYNYGFSFGFCIDTLPVNYTIKFDSNTGTGTMADQIIPYGVSTALTSNTFTKEEYVLKEWNTLPDGTGTSYLDGESVTNIGDTTLYAIWKEDPNIATITFNSNGGTFTGNTQTNVVRYRGGEKGRISKSDNVTADGLNYYGGYGQNIEKTDVITIPGTESLTVEITYQIYNSSSCWVAVYAGDKTPTPTNYSQSVSGKLYGTTKQTRTFTVTGDTAKIYFKTNTSPDSYYGYYAKITPTDAEANTLTTISGTYNEPTHNDYLFAGWNTRADGTGHNYYDEMYITSEGNITLYAMWKEPPTLLKGTDFCAALKETSYSTTNSNIKSITFDNVKKSETDYTSIILGNTPIPVDEYRMGTINAYKVLDTTDNMYDIYVLSNWDIYANNDCGSMFTNMKKLETIEFESFDTSKVTNMGYMFYSCSSLTSFDMSHFDTSKVTMMNYMFYSCSSLTSLNVSVFYTSSVTSMACMFQRCSNLTSLNVTNFDTSNVTSMAGMFGYCKKLTTLNVMTFNTICVTSMAGMFSDCSRLTTLDLTNFNTSNVKDMSNMFNGCISINNLNLSNFNTSKVSSMKQMFMSCTNLNSLNLTSFNTSKVNDMQSMFWKCENLTTLDLTNFDTSHVTTMDSMFCECKSLTSLNVSSFNTSQTKNMYWMFAWCTNLISLDLSNFNTSSVTDMRQMFYQCTNLISLNVSSFNTPKVKFIDNIFNGCTSLTDLDVSGFDTSKIEDMTNMFNGCSALTTIDVSNFNTVNCENMYCMFAQCTSLTYIDLSSFDTRNLKNTSYMFNGCSAMTTIYANESWNTGINMNSEGMFRSCYNLTGVINYNQYQTDINYANPTTGYFTTNMVSLSTGQIFNSSIKGTSYLLEDTSIKEIIFARTSKYSNKIQGLTGINVDSNNNGDIKSYKVSDGNGGFIVYVLSNNCICLNNDSSDLLYNLTALKNIDFTNFDIRNVRNANNMLKNCSSIETIYSKKGGWNVSDITTSTDMFAGCASLKGAIDYNSNKVTADYANPEIGYFTYGETLKDGNLINTAIKGGSATASTNDSNVKSVIFGRPFEYENEISSLTATVVDINNEGTINVYKDTTNGIVYILSPYRIYAKDNSPYMFANLRGITQMVFDNFYVQNATDTSYMFYYCGYTAMTSLDLGDKFDTSDVMYMEAMFSYCGYRAMTSLDLGDKFNTKNVMDMEAMFSNCGYTAMTSLDLGNKFDTSNVTEMGYMFYNCGASAMTSLDLTSFDVTKVKSTKHMFYNCDRLTTIYANTDWNTGDITNSEDMFLYCSRLVGPNLNYNSNKVNIEYANPTTGYFTPRP